jgi:hypothetical protein
MNLVLTECIIKHILSQFGVMPDKHVDMKKTKSLLDKELLLAEKISFQGEDGEVFKNDIWGCQLTSGQQEVKVLLGDCSQSKESAEYCLIVQLKGAPTYGLYLVYDEVSEPLIVVSTNEIGWLPCSTFLQATFLAGMEQVKETYSAWSKCTDYKALYDWMLSLIKYHNITYEGE